MRGELSSMGEECAVIEVRVSVLTFRRPDDLRALLPMLVEQLGDAAPTDGDPPRFHAEVLVVDNDPAGGAESVVEELGSAQVRYVCEPTPGIAAARNRALDEAPADGLVVFIDDDERPEPHWLARMLDTWSEHRPAAVGGPVEAVLDGPVDPWIEAGRFFHRAFREGLRTGMSVGVAPTGNILLDMSRVNAHGLRFDRSLGLAGGEDTLFTRQLVSSGETIVWCQEAVVLDPVPPSRLTRRWVVRRVFHVSNASISASIRLAGTLRERMRVRGRYLATGSGRVVLGALQALLGTVLLQRRLQARGVSKCVRGAGAVTAVVGLRFEEYRREGVAEVSVAEVSVADVTAVVTCMTDGERPWVREALESVARQTRPTKAVVCVADSNAWIEDAVAGVDADITVLRMPMAPSGEVRNAGVLAAGTDLVAFLDGDDAWAPTKIQQQVELLRKHSLDLIASKHVMIRDDGVPFFYAFADRMPMTSSWLGRKELFVETRFSSLLVGQDVELWHRLAPVARMGIIDAYLLRYRVRAGSRSQHTPSMRRKLRFERLSHVPLMRFGLLGGSRLLNVGLDVRRGVRGDVDASLLRVR